MAKYRMSKAVEAVGKMNFEGNIIPPSWFEHLRHKDTTTKTGKTKRGKPYPIAVILLSEIVYWHRPVEVRDEKTGKVLGHKQKFWADKWQRSYKSLGDAFGFSWWQVKRAMDFLEEKGLITREFRHIKTKQGDPLANVLFIELVPEKLAEITYRIDDHTEETEPEPEPEPEEDVSPQECKDGGVSPQICKDGVANLQGRGSNSAGTYTETPSENPTETPSSSSEEDEDPSVPSTTAIAGGDAKQQLLDFTSVVGGDLLHEMLQTEVYTNGNTPTSFKNGAQKRKFETAATRLGDALEKAMLDALTASNPVTSLGGMVNYLAKYTPGRFGTEDTEDDYQATLAEEIGAKYSDELGLQFVALLSDGTHSQVVSFDLTDKDIWLGLPGGSFRRMTDYMARMAFEDGGMPVRDPKTGDIISHIYAKDGKLKVDGKVQEWQQLLREKQAA